MIKKSLRFYVAVVLLPALLSSSAAGNRAADIDPESDLFSEHSLYFLSLKKLLLGEDLTRLCRAFVLPASSPEWAVYLTRKGAMGEEFHVVYKKMKVSLREEMLKNIEHLTETEAIAKVLDRFDKPFEVSTVSIDASTAILIRQAWNEVLSRIPLDPGEIVIDRDEATYYVSHDETGLRSQSDRYFTAGGTYPDDLAELAENLRQYAAASGKERTQIENTIAQKALSLLRKLQRRDL